MNPHTEAKLNEKKIKEIPASLIEKAGRLTNALRSNEVAMVVRTTANIQGNSLRA